MTDFGHQKVTTCMCWPICHGMTTLNCLGGSFYIKLHLSDTYNSLADQTIKIKKSNYVKTYVHINSVHDMFMCSVFLQVAAAEVAVWGASRAARCSWLSKSCMDLLHSLSLLWPCWRHLVSKRFKNISINFHWFMGSIKNRSQSSSTTIPRIICASCTEAHL